MDEEPDVLSAPRRGLARHPSRMPGVIIEYRVKEGGVLLILEAMKMQNEIKAPASGKVSGIKFKAGDSVQKGDVLLVVGG